MTSRLETSRCRDFSNFFEGVSIGLAKEYKNMQFEGFRESCPSSKIICQGSFAEVSTSVFFRAPSMATAAAWCQHVFCSPRTCPPKPVRIFKPCRLFAPLVATAGAYFQHLFRPDPGRHIDCVVSTHVLPSPPPPGRGLVHTNR